MPIRLIRILFLYAALIGPYSAFAQNEPITITGKILDQTSEQPVPYATVVVNKTGSSELVTGTTTMEDGGFTISSPTADVYLVVSFIGYFTDTISDLVAVNGIIDIGNFLISENSQLLDEVEVVGEVSRTTFELDKRVFNVGKDLSTTGASALEVLNHVPSVNVNIEGEISLRGSPGVQLLIDGKPTVLADDPGNALGTITADMIESVEVITNPSAKYEASGTSGILNIVLKKEEKKGMNGSVSINAGVPANHSFGVSLNRRTQKFNLFTQLGAGYRSLPRYSEATNRNNLNDTTIESVTDAYRNETFYNIRLGTDYHINSRNVLTLSGNFAFEDEDSPSEADFQLAHNNNPPASQWTRTGDTEASNPKWQFDLQYKKEFKDDKDHNLLMSALGSFFGKDQSSAYTERTVSGTANTVDQLIDTKFQRADYTFKLDYTDPISDKFTIEAGGQYEINDVGNDYSVQNLIDDEYVLDTGLTNDFSYDLKVLGVYGTAAYEWEKIGVKAGLRVENTDQKTLLATTNESSNMNFTNLFPSLHTSYKTSEQLSFQAGYSRRIRRPRLWDLNPFFNINNNFNVRTGNPNLQPEFTDSYELTSILLMEKFSLNASVYFRYTTDVIERVSIFVDNVNITTPINIGTNATTGFELNGKYTATKWLTFNGDLNINYFKRNGDFEELSFDFTGTQWTSRLSAKFKMPFDIEFEVTGNYHSGYETVQGDISDFAFLDLGLRKKFLKGKIVASLGVRDLFESRIAESIIDQPEYYLYSFSQRGRFVTFGVSYGFGKGEAMSYSGGRRH